MAVHFASNPADLIRTVGGSAMALDGLLLGWINLKATFSEVQLCSQAAAITSRTPCCKEVFDDVTVIIIIVKVILEKITL